MSQRSRSRSPPGEQADAIAAVLEVPEFAEEVEAGEAQADPGIASLLGGTPEQFDAGFATSINKNQSEPKSWRDTSLRICFLSQWS